MGKKTKCNVKITVLEKDTQASYTGRLLGFVEPSAFASMLSDNENRIAGQLFTSESVDFEDFLKKCACNKLGQNYRVALAVKKKGLRQVNVEKIIYFTDSSDFSRAEITRSQIIFSGRNGAVVTLEEEKDD